MKLILCFMTFIVTILFTSSCQMMAMPKEHSVNKDQIEHAARIKFPMSAQDIQVHTESGIDTLVVLRFTMNKDELTTFLKDAGYTESLRPDFRPFRSQELPGVPWWNPDEVHKLEGGVLSTEDWASEMMVDMSDSHSATVYLKAYEL